MAQSYTSSELTRRDFWMRWVPTFIGFIAGGALATVVAGTIGYGLVVETILISIHDGLRG